MHLFNGSESLAIPVPSSPTLKSSTSSASSSSDAPKVLLAGALARVASATVLFPVDSIKARIQFQNVSKEVRQYRNPAHAFLTILQEEGPRALFRGIPLKLIYSAPSSAISFAFYEQLKRIVYRNNSKDASSNSNSNIDSTSLHPDPSTNRAERQENEKRKRRDVATVAAAVGMRMFGTAVRCPLDVLRLRMQTYGSLFPSGPNAESNPSTNPKIQTGSVPSNDKSGSDGRRTISTTKAISILLKKEGPGALWSGYLCSLLRDVPHSAIYFSSYEVSKVLQRRWLGEGRVGHTWSHLLSGALAGGTAATCTIPMDVIKTLMQTEGILPKNERRFRTIRGAARTIFQEHGWKGFTRGLAPRLMYIMPASSLTFAFYESFKKLLGCHEQ